MDLTASFLAGSLLGLALPVGLLIVVASGGRSILRRRSGGDA